MDFPSRRRPDEPSLPADLTREAARTRLIPTEQAAALARPGAIGETYLEQQYDAAATEQLHLHAADGTRAAREESATGRSLAFARNASEKLGAADQPIVDAARKGYEQLRDTLTPFVIRRSGSSWGYSARVCGLLVGDVAGLSGAAISLGEVPALAVLQAFSAGVATITAGLAGAEIRHRQNAAQRQLDADSLPKELQHHRQLFEGGHRRRGIVVGMVCVAALVAILVSVGVYALRTSVEGTLSGITFGALAAAIATASFINSYDHADVVADAIDNARREYRRSVRSHSRLAGAQVIKRADQATERQRSILAEYDERGKAAASRIESLKFQALLGSPDVVGHGHAATQVGRKLRRGEAS